jgi:iron complex outermembrane receptor protein
VKPRGVRLSDAVRSLLLGLGCALLPAPARAQEAADLTTLSLDELMNLDVTTASRKPERLWSAPAGIDVVTADDIRRAGAQSLPDSLRLASGVHVGQPSARSWAVSIRGMNVLAANKISVVMDGRSLFTPFFSGVQWDAQDILLEDVERIEVVRGPVGSLWGAFAVNGFIQILPKLAWDTQGWLLSAGTGTEDPGFFAVRYGGKLRDDVAVRGYAKYFQTDWTYLAKGDHAQPATDFLQSGFRMDARHSGGSAVTMQGLPRRSLMHAFAADAHEIAADFRHGGSGRVACDGNPAGMLAAASGRLLARVSGEGLIDVARLVHRHPQAELDEAARAFDGNGGHAATRQRGG